MRLTVCFLTRNEEKHLGQALRSVQGLADQIVVADTGSTDRTVEIARALGAEVYAHAWADDFAAGRNFALERATGDWVLWLNPDEELLALSHTLVRQCINRPDAFAYGVVVQELSRPDRPDLYTQRVQVRLFRRHPEMRYVGRLHPDFQVPPEELARRENRQLLLSAIVIRHRAYLSQLTPDKLRWAARLLEAELRDRPGQLHYLIEYGGTLLLLNDPKGHEVLAEAIEKLRPLRDRPRAPLSTVQRLLEYVLTVRPEHARPPMSRDEAEELARRWFPNSPPLFWRMAEQAFQAEDYGKAAGLLEQLVQWGRTGEYDSSEPFDPSILGEPALMNLGICYVKRKDFDRAEQCFRGLLQSPAYQTQAVRNLALVQDLRVQAVRRSDVFWESGGA
jgi:Glycosyl transferase family 2